MSRLFQTSATSITLWTAILTVQAQTLLDLKSQGRNVDFSGAAATKPFRVGTTLPAICNVGEAFFKSDAPPGSNLYACTAANTWSVQSGGGGGASLPTTTNIVKGNGAGGAMAANPGVDYYKPGMVISAMDLPPNVAATDAQNTYSDPGNQYFGKYDVACDASSVSSDNVLVKKNASGACVQLTTSDTDMTSGVVGCLAAGSTTVNGRVRFRGVCTLKGTGTINTGDWITPSTTTGGYVQGSASRPAAGTVIIGRANGPLASTVPVDVFIDPNAAGGGGGGTNDHSLATNSTALTIINDNSAHVLSWDTSVSDSGGLHETVTHPDRFTIQHSGWYHFACQITANNVGLSSQVIEVRVLKNGTTTLASDFFNGSVASSPFRAENVAQLSATDYLTCDVRTNADANAALLAGVNFTSMQVSTWGGSGGGSTRRVCSILIGSDNGSALANGDLGPQGRQCFIPAAATVVEITIAADGGAPSVLVRKNHGGTTTNLTSAAVTTGASGALACANAAGSGTGIDGATTCSTALTSTSLAAGDWIELASGTAGGTAKRLSVAVIYTVN